ncbi:MAG: hypothetical protein DMG59_22720 [Acidobacteria bacterium]|nr:MAG: hypothetical protein DMG59_22720 [Acidobacteriota bacterium]
MKKRRQGPATNSHIGWRRVIAIIAGILRELSDESAYERHLEIHGANHSPEEWRRFSDERWNAGARRARCC